MIQILLLKITGQYRVHVFTKIQYIVWSTICKVFNSLLKRQQSVMEFGPWKCCYYFDLFKAEEPWSFAKYIIMNGNSFSLLFSLFI